MTKIITEETKEFRKKILVGLEKTLEIHLPASEIGLVLSFSVIEIFVVLYYGAILKFKLNSLDEKCDRCIISRGLMPIFNNP